MTQIVLYPYLPSTIEGFIRARRNFDGSGHERKYMFNATSPFTDLEGLRFSTITNSPYDFLKYTPTSDHLFLKDATLRGFEDYVQCMFNPSDEVDDWCYFKILKKLQSDIFSDFTNILADGKFKRSAVPTDFKIPICLIPVIEYNTLEQYSQVYRVKAACVSLEKTQIRMKLNTYFMSLQRLLKCSEADIINVLVNHGVLPSSAFSLVSTQKELTKAFSMFKKSGLGPKLGRALVSYESRGGLVMPKYGVRNQNLNQTLMHLFLEHPVYRRFHSSLYIDTTIEEDGKGRLSYAVPNKKRKYTDNPRDQSNLPKKWRGIISERNSDSVSDDSIASSSSDYRTESENRNCNLLSMPDESLYSTEKFDIVAEAMRQCAILIPVENESCVHVQ